MSRAIFIAVIVAMWGVTAVCGFVCWGIYATVQTARGIRADLNEQATLVTDHAIPVMDQLTYSVDDLEAQHVAPAVDQVKNDLHGVAGNVDSIAANVNRPCKGKAGPDACGVLAQANKVMIKASDAVVTTQTAELEAVPHMTRAMDAFADAAYSLDDAGSSGQTALDSFNDLLERKSLADAIDGVGTTAVNAGKISGDLYVAAHPILNPPPCHEFKCKMTRYVWPFASDAAKLGSDIYSISNLFGRAIPVAVK